MKLIISSQELESEFNRLFKKYHKYYWSVAWAGINSLPFKWLSINKDKIERIVVGIHFYQTHPDFIKEFKSHKKLKFINQPQGVFHPKLYLFYNSDTEWEIIIGSSNFTFAAFNLNAEANTLISNEDIGSINVLKNAFKLVNESWKTAITFSDPDIENYERIRKIHKPKLASLSGLYGSKKKISTPIFQVEAVNMTWKEFLKKVEDEDFHGLEDRIEVLDIAQELFSSKKHFKDLKLEERKFIAGIPNQYDIPDPNLWAYFGSMKGAGIYKNKIINNDINISKALDQIPLEGQITKAHYNRFINHFSKSFPGNYIATATRLLALKRPDMFYCLTSKNQKKFCKSFNVIKSEIDYNGYWEHVVERIKDSEWWLNPNPTNDTETKVSNYRAAFLDAIYYERD